MAQYNHTLTQRIFGTASDRVTVHAPTGDFFAVSRPGAVVSLQQEQVLSDSMDIARNELQRVIAITQLANPNPAVLGVPPAFLDTVEACFRLPNGAPAPQYVENVDRITAGLQRILLELQDPNVQIVDTNPNRSGGAQGYVRKGALELVTPQDVNRPVDFVGRIHVKFTDLRAGNETNIASTIIHEASHKFLGTRDWCYVPSMGAMGTLYVVSGRPAIGPWWSTTNAQGLNNADSWAAFVMSMP